MLCLVCAEAREAGDDVAERQVVKSKSRLLHQVVKALGCRVISFFVIDVFRRGADNRIPVHGGRYENSLSVLARHLEDSVLYIAAGLPVEEQIISFSRDDMNLVFRDHVVNDVRIDTRRVHHGSRADAALSRLDDPAAVPFFVFGGSKAFHLRVKVELDAVRIGIFCKCHRRAERADDSGRGCVQRRHRHMSHTRLQAFEPHAVDNFKALNPVLLAVFLQGLKLRDVLLAERQNQRAVIDIGKVQLFREIGIHQVAQKIVLCHQ